MMNWGGSQQRQQHTQTHTNTHARCHLQIRLKIWHSVMISISFHFYLIFSHLGIWRLLHAFVLPRLGLCTSLSRGVLIVSSDIACSNGPRIAATRLSPSHRGEVNSITSLNPLSMGGENKMKGGPGRREGPWEVRVNCGTDEERHVKESDATHNTNKQW